MLGLGENGHIASLFPHTAVLNEQEKWVSEVYVEDLEMDRITFTAPFINQASLVVFLVSGADKAQVLEKCARRSYHRASFRPADPHGRPKPIWLVEQGCQPQTHHG